jgi:hypothetical protein
VAEPDGRGPGIEETTVARAGLRITHHRRGGKEPTTHGGDLSLSTRTTRPDARRGGDCGTMWRRRRARSAGRKEEEEDSGGGGRRRGRWERKRRVIWTSDLREQGRGLGLGRRLWLPSGTVPLLDVAQIDAQRRGGAREAADQGGSKAGRRQGGGGGGRRGRLQYSAKSQSRPRCQSLITARSDHPLLLKRCP